MMKKQLAAAAAFAVLAFALAACGGNNGGNNEAPVGAGNSSAANEAASNGAAAAGDSAAGNVVDLSATNYKFDQEVYTVKAGEVTFNLTNAEGVHGVKVSNTDVNLSNDTKSQTVTLDNPGEYEIICSIPCGPGHVKMRAKLVVEA